MEPEEEEVMAASSDNNKRKLEDLEPQLQEEVPQSLPLTLADDDEEEEEEEAVTGDAASEAKRPRLDDPRQPPEAESDDVVDDDDDDLRVAENGYQSEKLNDERMKEDAIEQPPPTSVEEESNGKSEEVEQLAEEAPSDEPVKEDQTPSADDISEPSIKIPDNMENIPSGEEQLQDPSAEDPHHIDFSSAQHQYVSQSQTITRRMEIPNNKVGVLIGKAGDTIRSLQFNSGAKIQITRDNNADPYAATRPVELTGTLENINKAEKLIEDVIAEADAGGSPSLVARGFNAAQAAGTVEQIQIQVPNEKVGTIIGKGGETIKNLQTRSGARIQLIPQHLPEGDQSTERTVRVTGEKKQIEMAREMIKEVMNQPPRVSGGYNQQASRLRGPPAPSQWGQRGPNPARPTGYNYQQQAPHVSQNQQFPPHAHGNYPPQQQQAPRSSFGQGWEQRPPQSGGYDYYGRHGGSHAADAPASNHMHAHAPAMGPPPSQAHYNYGQPYSQTAPPTQSYGHGYSEAKYENQVPMQQSYGGHGGSQPGSYPQGGTYSQSYGPPRANQPGDMIPPQGHISTNQTYQNVPTQQSYPPYASSGPMQQQTYPQYDQPQSAAASATAPGYPQQVGQPGSGYGQPSVQQGYGQGGQTGGYGSYPTPQPGYTEQLAPNHAAAYGYQGAADQGYGGATGSAYSAPPASGQAGYAHPAQTTQQGYDQTNPQAGGYGSVPVGYNSQYGSTQMYGAHP